MKQNDGGVVREVAPENSAGAVPGVSPLSSVFVEQKDQSKKRRNVAQIDSTSGNRSVQESSPVNDASVTVVVEKKVQSIEKTEVVQNNSSEETTGTHHNAFLSLVHAASIQRDLELSNANAENPGDAPTRQTLTWDSGHRKDPRLSPGDTENSENVWCKTNNDSQEAEADGAKSDTEVPMFTTDKVTEEDAERGDSGDDDVSESDPEVGETLDEQSTCEDVDSGEENEDSVDDENVENEDNVDVDDNDDDVDDDDNVDNNDDATVEQSADLVADKLLSACGAEPRNNYNHSNHNTVKPPRHSGSASSEVSVGDFVILEALDDDSLFQGIDENDATAPASQCSKRGGRDHGKSGRAAEEEEPTGLAQKTHIQNEVKGIEQQL